MLESLSVIEGISEYVCETATISDPRICASRACVYFQNNAAKLKCMLAIYIDSQMMSHLHLFLPSTV